MTGHLLGGSGGIEAVATAMAIANDQSTADNQPGQSRSRVRSRLYCQL